MSSCAGCGLLASKAYGGGVWIRPDGKAVEYVLCRMCTAELDLDPQRLMAKVELRLGTDEARA
jgi:hypothetical protein